MARRRKKSGSKIVAILLLIAMVAGVGYVYTAPEFERVVPTIENEKNIYWNRTDPLKITLSDNLALKHYKIILSDSSQSITLGEGDFKPNTKIQTLLMKYPQGNVLNPKAKKLQLHVEVNDSSLWNFFQGNKSKKIIQIKVDYKRPNVNVLSNSYSITQGGSALIVLQADDENLEQLYVQIPNKKFKVTPYKKEG